MRFFCGCVCVRVWTHERVVAMNCANKFSMCVIAISTWGGSTEAANIVLTNIAASAIIMYIEGSH